MQEKFHPAPIWIENDVDYRDIRADLYNDPQDPDGEHDLFVRFSFPSVGKGLGAGATPYVSLVLGSNVIGEIALTHAQAALIGAPLDKATALWRPYYEGERAFPADLEAALETGIEHVQALTDARRAGTSMVESAVLLEDWAVAAANLLPEAPVAAAADFTAPELRLERGDVAVTLEWIGEGADGDYDPTDPGDEPLMRIGVERRVDGEWSEADDSSYCTQISARASQTGMVLAMQYVLSQVPAEGSVKRLMERMSWIELTPQDGDSPDFSRVPA